MGSTPSSTHRNERSPKDIVREQRRSAIERHGAWSGSMFVMPRTIHAIATLDATIMHRHTWCTHNWMKCSHHQRNHSSYFRSCAYVRHFDSTRLWLDWDTESKGHGTRQEHPTPPNGGGSDHGRTSKLSAVFARNGLVHVPLEGSYAARFVRGTANRGFDHARL
jgi:hypothetical protein